MIKKKIIVSGLVFILGGIISSGMVKAKVMERPSCYAENTASVIIATKGTAPEVQPGTVTSEAIEAIQNSQPDQENKIVITYNTASGSAVSQTVGTPDNPPKVTNMVPVRSGYTFSGWFDEKGNKIEPGTILTENTTLTAHWIDKNISWDVHIVDTTSSKIKLSVQTKNTATTYTGLNKPLILRLEGTRTTSEGSSPAVIQYQIVNKGNEYVATDWKNATDGMIRISDHKKCRIYIRAISNNYSKVYRTNGFYIDTKAPTISGVKNGKTYKKSVTIRVSDKVSGVKKITLNGKKVKNGKIISENGTYKLIAVDSVGNKKAIQFKIRK